MTPKFTPEEKPHLDGSTCPGCPHLGHYPCEACGEEGLRDGATKLCRPCWRVWRWFPAGVIHGPEPKIMIRLPEEP